MLSAVIVASFAENRAGVEDTAQHFLFAEGDEGVVDPPPWTYYHKPIIVLVMGGLLLGTGCVLSMLQYSQVVNVSYTMGTVCLSIGLIFLVTGMVWLPVIKQKLQHKPLAQKKHARSTAG